MRCCLFRSPVPRFDIMLIAYTLLETGSHHATTTGAGQPSAADKVASMVPGTEQNKEKKLEQEYGTSTTGGTGYGASSTTHTTGHTGHHAGHTEHAGHHAPGAAGLGHSTTGTHGAHTIPALIRTSTSQLISSFRDDLQTRTPTARTARTLMVPTPVRPLAPVSPAPVSVRERVSL